jgi:hypothetical protein
VADELSALYVYLFVVQEPLTCEPSVT